MSGPVAFFDAGGRPDPVEPGYWDVAGVWHDNDPTAEALVRNALAEASPANGSGAVVVVWDDADIVVRLTRDGVALEEGLVTLTYEDGNVHHFDASETVELTIAGPHPVGYHVLSLSADHPSDARSVAVIVASTNVAGPAPGERHWGVFVPLYALAHADRRAPSLADLDRLGALVHGWGGSIVGTLPLLATFLGPEPEPVAPSPYSPVSRLHWNELYLDLGTVEPPAPPGDVFDYRTTYLRVANALDSSIEPEGDAPPDVRAYAEFRADGDAVRLARHRRAQVEMRSQLADLAARYRERGQRLYLDLPVGTHPDGFDTRQHPHLFAPGMAVGAPPDAFFDQGQNWGFPPLQPDDPDAIWHFRDVVRVHMEVAGILRIDHVMGLFRLYWVPDGQAADRGVYVRYPLEAFLAVLSVESHRNDCWVVGEDLGTVPDEVRDAMHHHGLLGMWVAEFEEDSWWGGRPLCPPADTVACIDTHDTPPFALWLQDRDPSADPIETHAGILTSLGHSDAAIVLASMDDLWGETEPTNIPGTLADRPNWVRRLPVVLEDLRADERVVQPLAALHQARFGPGTGR